MIYDATAQPAELLALGWNYWISITASTTYLFTQGPINPPYNGFIMWLKMNTTVTASVQILHGIVLRHRSSLP